jgi:hypothetical protein
MTQLILAARLGAACLALAACGERKEITANVTTDATETAIVPPVESTTTTTVFPKGARIVEENGVTFRVDPDGTRVQLGPTDSRIVVGNGTRFRVDPDGTRVRIDTQGATIESPDVNAQMAPNPSVTVNSTR